MRDYIFKCPLHVISIRFWLIVCPEVTTTVQVAMRLYDEVASVPYMGKFIVFAKRPEVDEALIRCFCITDDKVDKVSLRACVHSVFAHANSCASLFLVQTLECQEGFDLVAASSEVEVVDNQPTWLEASGNLAPVVKADDQLRLHFNAFRENRLAFPVRIRDVELEPSGKLVFLRDPRPGSDAETKPLLPDGSAAQTEALAVRSICGLEVKIPTDLEHHHFPLQAGAAGSAIGAAGDAPNDMTSATSVGPVSVVSLSCSQPHQYEHVTQQQPSFDSHGRDLSVPPPSWVNALGDDAIARTQLDLIEVATAVGSDWPKLVMALFATDSSELPPSADNLAEWLLRHCTSADTVAAAGLNSNELRSDRDRALAILIAWKTEAGDAATGQLESGQMESTPDFVGDQAREVVEFSGAALVSAEPTLTTTTLEPSISETEPVVEEATLAKSETVTAEQTEEIMEHAPVEGSASEAVEETPINLAAQEEPFVVVSGFSLVVVVVSHSLDDWVKNSLFTIIEVMLC
ncbi:unnamed protein product [Dibothriocephalus latus]|uniref:Ankyrin UPA domain-containing protein n=1 Tax=Dibothriocephalus latus TaxID=60516 RepID=A0A3P7NKJ3_DIBLA|nr:unnamed protein product [Dibothriocephalus latus]